MKAYIITLSGNPTSMAAARACHDSAQRHGYDVEYFEASTGKTGSAWLRQENVKPITVTGEGSPALIQHQRGWLNQPGTIGCYASHYRLWQKAVEIQEPIVIFEHDALALAPFPAIDWQDVLHLECEGNLVRLAAEWAQGDRMETGTGVYRMGFRTTEFPDLVCMPCCHAYAIKPHAAQAMIADAKAHGWFAVDRAMREPVVMIETHNPSLATFQTEYMHVSSTMPWHRKTRQVGGILPWHRKNRQVGGILPWHRKNRQARGFRLEFHPKRNLARIQRLLMACMDLGIRAGRAVLPKPLRHFLWTRFVERVHSRLYGK